MESSNAGTEISGVNKEESDQSVMSPVPDLVTNVPDPTTHSTNTVATTTSLAKVPAKSGSPPNTKKGPPIPAELTVDEKSTSPSVEKSASIPSQPTPTPAPPRATSLPSAASEASVKNRSSREEKARKKDDKSVDHVLRALNSLTTTEEKLAAMCKKYADIFDEHRKLQVLYKQTDKKCSLLQREKELLQADHSKAILTRSRLENLCRELQRQNKAIKDESLLKIREEEEKRKEVSAKFQATMNEITTLMQQNNDNNMKLRDDNIDMTSKLKSICEQYEVRQQQVERISKQMQLEQQLAEAKLTKLRMEMGTEREVLLKEKQQLLLELQQYQQRCKEFQNTEVNLRNQISMYNDKYDEFQKALERSNDVFGGFKGEMEKMSKKICKLEKETSSWKQRWERSHNALLEMAADKQRSEQELSVVSRQLVTLQGLCRTLQTERASLMAKLRGLQAVGLETLEKTVPEKCTKQCEQSLNCLDQSANHLTGEFQSNHLEQPANHIVKNDPVLVQYNQDILASFKEAVEAEDSCNSESVPTECTKPSLPVPTSPLPDVVGVTTTCVSEKTPDVNSVLCERLEGVSLNPSAVAVGEKTSSLNAEVNGSSEKNNLTNEVSTNKQPASQVVLNGDNLSNGLPPAPLLQESPKSPAKESPTKSSDNIKKTKEPSKKKKK